MKFSADQRFKPSGLNSAFSFTGTDFESYIAHSEDLIKRARIDLSGENAEKIVADNSPFEWKPENFNGSGVLLIHGLYDSPFAVQDVAKYFYNKGYLVRAILLPGHGTVPADLLGVSYKDWLLATEFGINSFNNVERLFVAGFSTGALLAHHHALTSNKIDGIISFAPAFEIKSRYAFMADWHKVISWAIERTKWVYIGDDNDPAKYESLTFNSAHQVYMLGNAYQKLNKVHEYTLPTFFTVSDNDELIRTDYTINYFNSLSCEKQMLIYSTKDLEFNNEKISVVNSKKSDENILNFSHACIPISPDNPHYGRNGDYKDFRHYRNWALNKYQEKLNQEIYQGALTVKNLEHYHLQKLNYNPYFEDMMVEIDNFMAGISQS